MILSTSVKGRDTSSSSNRTSVHFKNIDQNDSVELPLEDDNESNSDEDRPSRVEDSLCIGPCQSRNDSNISRGDVNQSRRDTTESIRSVRSDSPVTKVGRTFRSLSIVLDENIEHPIPKHRSLWLFSHQNKFRVGVFRCVTSSAFTVIIWLSIVMSSLLLAFQGTYQVSRYSHFLRE